MDKTFDSTWYAKWKANKYVVELDYMESAVGGGIENCKLAEIEVLYDGTYYELPHPYKDRTLFKGWFTASEGGIQIKNTDTVNITENTTLYAQWDSHFLPDGLHLLEYISCNGAQYIDTELFGSEKTEAGGVAELTANNDSYNRLLGDFSDTSRAITINLQNNNCRFGNESINCNMYDSGKHLWFCNRYGVWEDSVAKITYSGNQPAFTTKRHLWFGANNANNGIKGNIYSGYIKENDLTVRNFIPVVYYEGEFCCSKSGTRKTQSLEKGTVGFFDLVENVLYLNSGSGSFVAGPESD